MILGLGALDEFRFIDELNPDIQEVLGL